MVKPLWTHKMEESMKAKKSELYKLKCKIALI